MMDSATLDRTAGLADDGAVLRVGPAGAALDLSCPTGNGAARGHRLGWVGAVTAAVDLAAIAAAFALGAVIADGVRGVFDVAPIPVTDAIAGRSTELPILAALMIGVFAFGGLYRRATWEIEEIKRIVQGVALVALFDAAIQFAIKDHSSRLWFFAAYPLVALSVIGARSALRAVPGVRAAMTSHVVLIGSGMAPDLLIHELRESRAGHVQLARTMGFEQIDGHDPGRLLALLGRLAARLGVPAERVQILLAPGPDEQAQAQAAIAHLDAAGCPYSVVLPFDGLSRHGFHVHKVVGADVVIADLAPMGERRLSRGLKRAIDLGLAIPGAILTAPLLAAIAALLLCEGGPVLFAQCRVGRGGRRFRCFKFRTMLPDAEARLADLLRRDPGARAEWETYQKLARDPRITPLGRFLRRSSLDELPQLLNVIKGEMSLVGPRPIVAPELPGYPGDRAYFHSPAFSHYASMTPGITGLWQVAGRAGTTHDERVRLDRWYARNWSPWLDLLILLKTARAVLARQGSL